MELALVRHDDDSFPEADTLQIVGVGRRNPSEAPRIRSLADIDDILLAHPGAAVRFRDPAGHAVDAGAMREGVLLFEVRFPDGSSRRGRILRTGR